MIQKRMGAHREVKAHQSVFAKHFTGVKSGEAMWGKSLMMLEIGGIRWEITRWVRGPNPNRRNETWRRRKREAEIAHRVIQPKTCLEGLRALGRQHLWMLGTMIHVPGMQERPFQLFGSPVGRNSHSMTTPPRKIDTPPPRIVSG